MNRSSPYRQGSSPPRSAQAGEAGPSFFWLAAGFLLAGLGTVLLGPILPTLASHWHLSDAQGGQLFLAKFVGAFLGGVSVPRRLRWGILSGTLLAGIGFGLFAVCHSLAPAAAALFISGIGLGQIIAATNILAGRRYQAHTGSTLALLNFFWSLGAVLTGLLAAALLPRAGLREPLLIFAALFVATGVGGSLRTPPSSPQIPAASAQPTPTPVLPLRAFIYFSLLLLLYGGLETCLTAWLTTYTLRFSDVHLLGGQSAVVLLWASLTGGRIIASAALRFFTEAAVQRVSLALSLLFILVMIGSRHAFGFSLSCILLGISLAPYFPSTFALLMPLRPSARAAGFILAISGLGAALFPWSMGVLSSHAGSLRTAMSIPLCLTACLLLLSFISPTKSTQSTTRRTPFGGENQEKIAV